MLAEYADERIGALHEQLNGLNADGPRALPAFEPEIRAAPDIGPDLTLDFDMG